LNDRQFLSNGLAEAKGVQAYVLEVENTALGCQSSSEAFRVTLSENLKQYNVVQSGKGAIVTSILWTTLQKPQSGMRLPP
jgi:hypothetical protein